MPKDSITQEEMVVSVVAERDGQEVLIPLDEWLAEQE